ncbi:putative pentatricopeptide repeat-containing protein At1g12700, mitochondrial [Cryptomeria japonica]|uniref:putative pentatricopeptide repeat-containing protein At1g12700, mitochondrial n=1 Tax=Cryptomeria japonica TaxID=3369 RepID=UPI0027DA68B4|nr:putative pentatricopeptide repeat-containing protein At1g12700, mitochondrial [Cryptomeria japonica]
MSIVLATTSNAAKEKTPLLSKFVAHPPFELPIMTDIPLPSRYKKGKRSSCVPSSLLAPSSQPMLAPSVPLTSPRAKRGRALVVVNMVPLQDASLVLLVGPSPILDTILEASPMEHDAPESSLTPIGGPHLRQNQQSITSIAPISAPISISLLASLGAFDQPPSKQASPSPNFVTAPLLEVDSFVLVSSFPSESHASSREACMFGFLEDIQALSTIFRQLLTLTSFEPIDEDVVATLSLSLAAAEAPGATLASVTALCKSGNTNKAWDLFHSALIKRCPLDVVSFTALLDGLVNSGDLCRIKPLLAEMGELGIHRNVITYSPLIKALCERNQIEEAYKLLQRMRHDHCFPDIVTFNTLIDGTCKIGRISETLILVAEMIQDDLSPNTVTYNTLMCGLCKVGREDEAIRLLAAMRHGYRSPNIVTYSTLIDGLCKVERVDEALVLVAQILQDGHFLNIYTYTNLIDGFYKAGKTEKAYNLFVRMMEFGPLPDVVTFSAVIDGLCKDGRMDKACDCFHIMSRKGLQPNVITYNSLIDGLCKLHEVDKAQKLFKEMLRRGCSPNVVTYSILIDVL